MNTAKEIRLTREMEARGVICAYELGDEILEIYRDEDPENPREWDNLGIMVCWHRRYRLGDPHNFQSPEDFERQITEKNAVILPLYLLDHSGITMRTTPFGDPWDSGQVGWIYAPHDIIQQEFGKITEDIRRKVIQVLNAEVEVYNSYLRGDVYGFVLRRKSGKVLDKCWGFYGYDIRTNGIAEHLSDRWQEALGLKPSGEEEVRAALEPVRQMLQQGISSAVNLLAEALRRQELKREDIGEDLWAAQRALAQIQTFDVIVRKELDNLTTTADVLRRQIAALLTKCVATDTDEEERIA